MERYLERARAVLERFRTGVAGFEARISGEAGALLTAKQRDALDEIAGRLRTAVGRLEHSIDQISGETALDVVDLQARMEGESAALAAALKALGETLERAPDVVKASGATLRALEEDANRAAAALFPNAIDGVRDINQTLWLFRPLWQEYIRVLADQVTRRPDKGLTSDQLARVESTAAAVRDRFDAVNELLNTLVVGGDAGNPAEVKGLIRRARESLSEAVREARSRASTTYKPFHGVLKRAERLARKIDGQFARLRVPVFPRADGLDDLTGLIEPARYQALSGVERFALFNIVSRLRSVGGQDGGQPHLLAPEFAIRIFDVFPDRVYFTADAAFLDAVEGLEARGVFEAAPASLHRFHDGSFKQRQSRKGNLQLSYARGSADDPDDASVVRVDADIDLYRTPVRHLFGEVLINHLTGRKTDQFRVYDFLASSEVAPIGGFEVVSV
jgi:hypothetical protein